MYSIIHQIRGLDIPVFIPRFGAGIYFLMGARLHSEALVVNSYRFINMIIPSRLDNSGLLISLLRLRFNCMFFIRRVDVVCSYGKEHKNNQVAKTHDSRLHSLMLYHLMVS